MYGAVQDLVIFMLCRAVRCCAALCALCGGVWCGALYCTVCKICCKCGGTLYCRAHLLAVTVTVTLPLDLCCHREHCTQLHEVPLSAAELDAKLEDYSTFDDYRCDWVAAAAGRAL